MKWTKKSPVAAAILALTLTACTSGADDTEKLSGAELASRADYNPQPVDKLQDGGTYTTAIGEIPENMNQIHVDLGGDGTVLGRFYNPQLQLISPEGEVSFNSDYVTDVKTKLVGGNRVVTYDINPKAAYNDGTPIDYRSFQARWKVANGKDTDYAVFSTEGYDLITSVEKGTSAKQAVVTYDGSWVWWKSQFATLIHPDAAKNPDTFNTAYIGDAHDEWGAGPFHLKSFDPNGTSMVFERNPKWWGTPAKLDQRIFRVMEPAAAINAFRNGELDSAKVLSAEDVAKLKGMSGIETRKSVALSTAFVHINADSPKLKDVNVRKAVALGIDRATLQKVRYQGMGWDEKLPGSMTLYPFQDGYRDNYTEAGGKFDTDEAKTLLDEAGWKTGDDGIRVKDGQRLELVWPVIGDQAFSKNTSVAVQAMLKDIGVDLKLDFRSADAFTDTYSKKDYDLFSLNWGTADPDEGFFYFCGLYCSDAGYINQETIEALAPQAKEIGKIADRTKAVDAFMDLELEAYKSFQVVPLYNGPTMLATKKGYANVNDGPDMFHFGPNQDIGLVK